MSALKRILGFILVATAIVVGVNWVITPIHHDGSPQYPVWKVVNWFMAFSVLVALIANIARKRAVGNEGSDIVQSRVNAWKPTWLSTPRSWWLLGSSLTF